MDTEFDIEQSVGFLIAKTHQRLFAHFREALLPFGITPPQFAVLAFLWKADGLTQTELSDKCEVDRTTLGGVIDRLEQLGLVTRAPDPADRRAHRVVLTAAGHALRQPVLATARTVRERFSGRFTPQEYRTLCELLNRLRVTP